MGALFWLRRVWQRVEYPLGLVASVAVIGGLSEPLLRWLGFHLRDRRPSWVTACAAAYLVVYIFAKIGMSMLSKPSKRIPVPKQFVTYVIIVGFIVGLLRLAGLSLLDAVIAWLAASLVCVAWAFERIYRDIEELRQDLGESKKEEVRR
jgi:hypothetical protein